MVFANCPTINPTIPSTSVVEPVVATMPAETANLTAIPMWGVQQISGANLLMGNTNLTIHVLRALAKVEISISAEGYTLVSASFKQFNKNINCIPNGFSSVTATTQLATGTSAFAQGQNSNPASFNPNSSGAFQTEEVTSLSFVAIEGGSRLVAYVPEYLNTSNNLAMTVNVSKEGTETSHQLPFKYTETAVRDVIRNYYYTYNIVAVNRSEPVNGLELKYMVTDWNEVTGLDLNFGYGSGDAFVEGLPEPYDPESSEDENGNTGNEGDETPEQ